jgi:hypothetical protein
MEVVKKLGKWVKFTISNNWKKSENIEVKLRGNGY